MREYDPTADSYGSWALAIATLRAELVALMNRGLTREQAHEEMQRRQRER